MRYYIYISKTKIEMLYSQISNTETLKKTLEIKADIKIAGIKRSTEKEPAMDDYRKLETIIKYINENWIVGSVENPNEWIYGIKELAWSVVEDYGISYFFTPLSKDFEGTILGLGGSIKHIVGNAAKPHAGNRICGSHLIDIASYLRSQRPSEFLLDREEYQYRAGMEQDPREPGYSLYEYSDIAGSLNRREFVFSITNNVEFLAKRLWSGSAVSLGGDRRFKGLIATPLYVALAD